MTKLLILLCVLLLVLIIVGIFIIVVLNKSIKVAPVSITVDVPKQEAPIVKITELKEDTKKRDIALGNIVDELKKQTDLFKKTARKR